ncbi:hypothetical protein FB451DRAFT_1185956 [Mycena latifolia]|nr:hypothetical protein FB451DRAFT_1185956 [Mycena latifolia]
MNAELLLEKETPKNIEKNKVQRGNTISNSFYAVIEYTRVTNVIDPKTGQYAENGETRNRTVELDNLTSIVKCCQAFIANTSFTLEVRTFKLQFDIVFTIPNVLFLYEAHERPLWGSIFVSVVAVIMPFPVTMSAQICLDGLRPVPGREAPSNGRRQSDGGRSAPTRLGALENVETRTAVEIATLGRTSEVPGRVLNIIKATRSCMCLQELRRVAARGVCPQSVDPEEEKI